jgi:hypothetical protein
MVKLSKSHAGPLWATIAGSAAAMTTGTVSLRAAVILVAVIAVRGALSLLLQWHYRRTLLALVKAAPGGTRVTLRDRAAGCSLAVTMGGMGGTGGPGAEGDDET